MPRGPRQPRAASRRGRWQRHLPSHGRGPPSHLRNNVIFRPGECADCHVVPATLDAKGHMDGTVDITMFKIVKNLFRDTAGKYAGND